MKVSEYQPKPDQVPVILLEPASALLQKVRGHLEKFEGAQLLTAASPFETLTLVRQAPYSLVLFSLAQEDQGNAILSYLKMVEQQVRARVVRIVVMVAFKGPGADFWADRLKTAGATEVLPEPMPEKSLTFKLDRLIKAAPKSKTQQNAGDGKERKGLGAKNNAESAAKQAQVKMVPMLSIESDCFFQRGAGQVRRVSGRWMVQLYGPGPSAGRWQDAEDNSAGRRYWRWVPLPDWANLIPDAGSWCFAGERAPEFKDGIWTFVGRKAELVFIGESKVRSVRFETDPEGNLLLSKDNSDRHQEKLPKLQESWEAQLKHGKADTGNDRDGKGKKRGQSGDAPAEMEREPEVRWAEPLKLASDFWLLDKRAPRRVARRWRARLFGPGRNSGRWIEIEKSQAGAKGESLWKWTPHDRAKDPFHKDDGDWVYRGLPPIFDEGLWTLFGQSLELSFRKGEDIVETKLLTNGPDVLLAAKDSEQAVAFIPLLEATHDVRINRNKEDAADDELEEKFAKDAEGGTELDGTFSKDEKESSELSAEKGEPEAAKSKAKKVITIPRDHFGAAGKSGHWLEAADASDGSTWYLLVTPEFQAFAPEEIYACPSFWLYRGFYKPVTSPDQKDWLFRNDAPEELKKFDDLPKPVQAFLIQKKLSPDEEPAPFNDARQPDEKKGTQSPEDFVATAEEGVGLTDKRGKEKKTEREINDKLTPDEEPAPFNDARKPEAAEAAEKEKKSAAKREREEREQKEQAAQAEQKVVQNREQQKKEREQKEKIELEAKTKAQAEIEAAENAKDIPPAESIKYPKEKPAEKTAAEKKEPEADAGVKSAVVESLKDKLKDQHDKFPLGTLEAVEKVSREVQKRLPDERKQAKEAAIPDAVKAKGAPGKVQAAKPPGPSLTPLAMAFLVSELVTQGDRRTPRQMGDRFAVYLGASLGGLGVEFWIQTSAGWSCAGSSLDEGGAGKLSPAGALPAPTQKLDAEVGTVRVNLVVSGEESSQVDLNYLGDVLQMGRGIFDELALPVATAKAA